ncbi:aldo/keto reductase [Microbacterium sp. NIBRBAC000506063]|uniref:aldo/keto reductase n=1 Tax=Microbacterium sp. NIBRBAC000506063 TaxID=2734618 RepID=UPI001BB50209|nr:aldo/keto reductase [Microbacterium sp. NIBRBAC000506063]QTV79075.1 aldo/keto reductase [Microbacterium sp. NIBRBAC000506063]
MTLTQTLDADRARGVHAVQAALDAGVTLFDTADSYGPTSEMGVNEQALVAALRTRPEALARVIIATKGGHTRGPHATWWIDGSPEHLAQAARNSLRRIGLEALPLYQHHRPDPRVPYADSMGALRQLVEEGIALRIGVSNVDETLLRIAIDVLGDALVSVQNEYSPLERSSDPVLRMCEEHGLAFLAWGPFGGMRAAKGLGEAAPVFARVAERHGVSVQRVALAWLLSLSPRMIALPGASRPESVRDSAQATALALDEGDLVELAESSFARGGDR